MKPFRPAALACVVPGMILLTSLVLFEDKDGHVQSTSDGSQSIPIDTTESSDKAAVRRAVLDYVDGVYQVRPDWIQRSVHPKLRKFGFWRPHGEVEFRDGKPMTFAQLKSLAAEYNRKGRLPADAPREVEVFDVMDRIATAKLTAVWGVDYFHLIRENGRWKILQVVWQSQTPTEQAPNIPAR